MTQPHPPPCPPATNGGSRAADPREDPWAALRQHTVARIALGRAGGSQRTASLLEFRLAHARARDAVHTEFDPEALARQFFALGIETEHVSTAVSDRATFLMRPDLGRQLADTACKILKARAGEWGRRDLVILVSDGHSANAALRHAAETVARLVEMLDAARWTRTPVLIVPFGRVKLQDEVGALLRARHTLMFLGERPGLSAPDSLGAYFTWRPGPARTDADRNCVSNIRPEGTPPAEAARKLAQLLQESARLGVSGVALKDEQCLAEETAEKIEDREDETARASKN
jgi:ethanolamine ammonia-lyase small subunit